MIFFAVASPTPGRASSSFWDAVLRSMSVFFGFAPSAVPVQTRRTRSRVSQDPIRNRSYRIILPPFVTRPGAASPVPRARTRPGLMEKRCGEEGGGGDAEKERARPYRLALRQRGDGSESDRDLEEGHGVGEAVVMVEQLVGLPGLLVALLFLLPGLLLDLFLLLAIALLLLGVFGGRLLRDREPRGSRRLGRRRLDPFGLVIRPLVGSLGLQPRRLRLQ